MTRVGSEFQVNAYTNGTQNLPAVAADADGDFVVAWQGVFVRLFSSAGAPLTGELLVNTFTTGSQSDAAVAMDADGDFVVVWSSNHEDQSYPDLFARRFSSAGGPLTGELQVNTFTAGIQYPAVAASASGDFVVVWSSNGQDGSDAGVFARLFSSAGMPLTGELQVNTYTPSYQTFPGIAADADGDFVVAWSSAQDGSGSGVFARRFSSAGTPLAGEFQINAYTNDSQRYPSVAAGAEGDFVVAWESHEQDGAGGGVFARRFSSAGIAQGIELQVNTYTPNTQNSASVAADASGDFVVAWASDEQDGADSAVFARGFSSAGEPLDGELQVNSYTIDSQRNPSVAAGASGGFVVAWASFLQDGLSDGVFAQRFEVTTAVELDVDGNGATQALTDGLLVLRRFFGLGGTALTSGVVGAGCTRCDAAAIEPYIAGLGLTLDIDGNGSTQALADGLLAVRYLFGLRDVALTGGAVGGGCTRCDAVAIEPYIASLVN
jgi:hypothetical protein